LYSALDVYLMTSRVEGGPCTVFEAMACGTAVVSTRVGAVSELIVDGINGYSADVDDSESLLSAIVALNQSLQKRIEIANAGMETVSKLPWGAVFQPLEGFYDQLIQISRSKRSRLPGPAWMSDPQGLLRATCAADALGDVITRVRRGSLTKSKGVRLLQEMLHKQSIVDIARGAALMKGWNYKPDPETNRTIAASAKRTSDRKAGGSIG
jgi:hypothetical protein